MLRLSLEAPLFDGKDAEPTETFRLNLVRVSDVQPEEVKWLWRPRIALGKVTVLAGHPGGGKSTLSLDIAARVSRGKELPCGEGTAPKGSVVFLTVEDDIGDTIRPRLDAAGADVDKVCVLTSMIREDKKGRRTFDLLSDIGQLEAACRKIGDVALIVIDPVSAYLGKPGKLDSYRNSDMRSALMPLQEMAPRLGAAIIAIDHLTKGSGNSALMRIQGSVALVGLARATHIVEKDEEDPKRRLFLPAKNNLGDDQKGCAFRMVEKPTGYDHPAYCVALDWEGEHVTITADEALNPPKKDGRKSDQLDRAKLFIMETMAGGPVPTKDIDQKMIELGFSEKTIRNAKRALGVKSTQTKDGWVSSLSWNGTQVVTPL